VEGAAVSDRACRACGAGELELVLSLGETPLANALREADSLREPEPVFPLDLAFCAGCSLLQILEAPPPDALFADYCYFSSFSDTMLRHAEQLARELIAARGLDGTARVVEAASNDGYLLQHYQRAGVPVLGIEPAKNVGRVARERGIPTCGEFFTEALARRLAEQDGRADVFHAHNVLAHVPDLDGFVRGIATILAPGGVAVIEVPYVKDMLDQCEFDTIYHEHLCYFSLTALDRCFSRHGLVVEDVQRVSIHGGSLRLFAAPAARVRQRGARALSLLAEEAAWGVSSIRPYLEFAARVERLRGELTGLLARLKREGRRIAAYGASAKGSTLLNCFGIGRETLDFVVDRSTVKQGRYTPGTHLPIRHPDLLLEAMPDHTLLLTWNFAGEILEQQRSYRQRGGRFIIPLPEPAIV
jgi:SAM-dependent methyltransferase